MTTPTASVLALAFGIDVAVPDLDVD